VVGGRWLYQRTKPRDGRPPFPAWLALVLLPIALASQVTYLWVAYSVADGAFDYFVAMYNSWMAVGVPSAWLLMHVWPGQKLVEALVEFQTANGAVGAAEGYIRSCEEWTAKGVSSPVDDARRALVDRVTARDEALARLQALGYRRRCGA
jgi:hypothetical protein